MRIPAQPLTFRVVERREQQSPSSAQAQATKMIEDRLPGRKIAGQKAPGTASMEHIEDRIEDAAQRVTSRSAGGTGLMQIGLQARPFGIGEVAGIGRVHTEHCSLFCRRRAYKTPSDGWVLHIIGLSFAWSAFFILTLSCRVEDSLLLYTGVI